MVEAEREIIACLLTSKEQDIIYDRLSLEAFNDTFCKECYRILSEEHKNGEEHDVNMLAKKLLLVYSDLTEIEVFEKVREIVYTDIIRPYVVKTADLIQGEYVVRQFYKIVNVNNINGSNVYQEIERINQELSKIQSPATVGMDMSDLVSTFKDNYFIEKEDNSVKTGFDSLDEFLMIDGGDIVVVGARPGVGKTAFAVQMAAQMSDKGKKVLLFNLEMAENQIFERMISMETGFNLAKIKKAKNLVPTDRTEYNKALERIEKRSLHVVTGSQRLSTIRINTKAIKPDAVIIDYLQLVEPEGSYKGNRYAEVGQISHGLKALALELKIPIFVLTQLNRTVNSTKEPSMNEIRESGDVEQDASIILLLWNKEESDNRKKVIKVEKNRQGQLRTFSDTFEFDANSMKFIDVTKFHAPSEEEIIALAKTETPLLNVGEWYEDGSEFDPPGWTELPDEEETNEGGGNDGQ